MKSRQLHIIEQEVLCFEANHLIETRWTSETKEYQLAAREHTQHKYLKAVDELERLVVQRLLEMAKLGIAGVGALTSSLHTLHGG